MFTALITVDCSRSHRNINEEDSRITQTRNNQNNLSARPAGKGRGRNQNVRGRGFGQRSQRVWQLTDVIHLTPEEEKAIGLETYTVKRMPLRVHLLAMGKVLENQYRKAIVSYAFSARIAERHVRVGNWVKKGQKLITLQSEEVGNAKSDFYKAQADFELARVNFEREKRLLDRGVGARKNFLTTEAEFKVAEANLNATEKKLHVLGFTEAQVHSISETHQINPVITLYSPIGGKVVHDNAVLGAMIDQSNEILTIMDPSFLHIDAEIYEKGISKIKDGLEVEATVLAFPEDVFKGKISYISDVLNSETRTIKVRTDVENSAFKLKPGMFADIKIFLNNATDVVMVPKEAVLDDRADRLVFVKEDEHYRPVLVEAGSQMDGFLEIVRGLEVGSQVVTIGNFQLKSKLYESDLEKGHIH